LSPQAAVLVPNFFQAMRIFFLKSSRVCSANFPEFQEIVVFSDHLLLFCLTVFNFWIGYHNHPCWFADGSIASVDEGRGSPCQLDACGDSQAAKRMMCSIPALPEVLCHNILQA
jgi:hypothetical protein